MLQRRRFLYLSLILCKIAKGSPISVDRCIPPGLQPPKFWFGDQVCYESVCDDQRDPENFGKPLRDYGVVIGLFFSSGSSYHLPGWNYFVSWRWVGGEATNNSDWDDAAHESNLKLGRF